MAKNEITKKKQDIIDGIAEKTGLTKKASEEAFTAMIDTITEFIVNEHADVNIRNFGKIQVKHMGARRTRNPKTGETLFKPEHLKVKFKISSVITDRL